MHLYSLHYSSDYIITFVSGTRVWIIARVAHQLVVSLYLYIQRFQILGRDFPLSDLPRFHPIFSL